VARARAVAPEVGQGNVYLPGVANPEGKNYDRVDTLSQTLNELAGPRPTGRRAIRPRSG